MWSDPPLHSQSQRKNPNLILSVVMRRKERSRLLSQMRTGKISVRLERDVHGREGTGSRENRREKGDAPGVRGEMLLAVDEAGNTPADEQTCLVCCMRQAMRLLLGEGASVWGVYSVKARGAAIPGSVSR